MQYNFFFFQPYNSLWVLACWIISFQWFLSCVLCFRLVTPIFLKSFLTSSSHISLGLPFSLIAYGLYFMYLAIFSLLNAFSNSSFVLSLHCLLAFCVGPNILLNIFLSNTNNFCLMFSVKTQHSDPYTTTDLIRALYNLVLVFLNISLLWSIFCFAKEAQLPATILSFITSSIRLSLVTIVLCNITGIEISLDVGLYEF